MGRGGAGEIGEGGEVTEAQELRLHRLALKICLRCGKHRTAKTSPSMWKKLAKYLTCAKCRKIDRERKQRKKEAANGTMGK